MSSAAVSIRLCRPDEADDVLALGPRLAPTERLAAIVLRDSNDASAFWTAAGYERQTDVVVRFGAERSASSSSRGPGTHLPSGRPIRQ